MNRRLAIPDFSQTSALQWVDGRVTSEICGVQMGKSIQANQPPVSVFHIIMTQSGLMAASLPCQPARL